MSSYRSRGFTLIEVMLAISIFAGLTLMTSQISRYVIQSHARVHRRDMDIKQINLALLLLERDISQMKIRQSPEGSPPNLSDLRIRTGDASSLELVRRNWINPGAMLERSSVERVRYSLTQEGLLRESAAADDNRFRKGHSVMLLHGVTSFRLRFWQNGQWQSNWHASSVMPQATEVVISMPRYGELRRVITTEQVLK